MSWDPVSVPPEEEDEHAAVETGMVLRRSTRERKELERLTASQPGELHNVYGYCSLAVGEEPTTMKLALESDHKEEWAAALREEHNSIARAGTFELVDRFKGKKVLSTNSKLGL